MIDCGDGIDVVQADELDQVAANCETVERVPGMVEGGVSGDVQTQAFNCWANAENPHKSNNQMVAKGHFTCETDNNRISLNTTLDRWRYYGWQPVKTKRNYVDQTRKAAHTNVRWDCNNHDNFYWRNRTYGTAYNNNDFYSDYDFNSTFPVLIYC